MSNNKITVINENGEEKILEIITAFSYKDKDYIVFSNDKDNDTSNVYISRLIRGNDGYDSIEEIEDDKEREEVHSVIKEVIESLK